MKRRHVLLIAIILIGGWLLLWPLSPRQEVAMFVVDKTVPEPDYREHRAIFWIAEHGRFGKPGGGFYQHETDYLGYHPDLQREDILTAADLEDQDLLYLADAYGVYDYEEGLVKYEEQLSFQHQDIELLYGGFNLDEVEAIEEFAGFENKVLIGEHNIFGYPTYLDPEASQRLQEVFGVTYTGWLSRYFADLDEAAFWLKELYSRIYGQEWDFKGSGMIFVREDNPAFNWQNDLVVVDAGDFNYPWPVLINTDHLLTGGASGGIPYLYWLEVHEVKPEAQVLAYYDLPLAEEARIPLQRRGLPDRFPAMILHASPEQATRIYFAGDFADQLPALLTPRLAGSAGIQRFMSYFPGLPVEYRFYFQWYEPVLKNILEKTEVTDDNER